MRLFVLGVNHRMAPVELREQLALSGERLEQATQQLKCDYPAAEIVVVSTCNRTEFYVAKPSHEPPLVGDLQRVWANLCHVDLEQLVPASMHREDEQAIDHLLRVTCGLESMVLGEPQVLGQVKRAYEQAIAWQAVGPVLHKVFQNAIATAKRARHETGIGSGRMSIGSVAVDFAQRIFERFDDKTVVGVGAGEMAKLMMRHLRQLEPARLWVMSRSLDRARTLADRLDVDHALGGARSLDSLDELLVEADIVLTGTAATKPIITASRLKPLLRRRRYRPLFVIDIAVPRNVAAAVGSLKNVYLYNIDDLQRVVAKTQEGRTEQITCCEAMIENAAHQTLTQIQNREMGQIIRALRERLHELGRIEQERALRKLSAVSPEDLAETLPRVFQQHTHRLINKILHLPLTQLEGQDDDARVGYYAAALRRLFALDDGPTSTDEKSTTETPEPVPSRQTPSVKVRATEPV